MVVGRCRYWCAASPGPGAGSRRLGADGMADAGRAYRGAVGQFRHAFPHITRSGQCRSAAKSPPRQHVSASQRGGSRRAVMKARQPPAESPATTRTHISHRRTTRSLVPPEGLYEVCDEDAADADADVEREPKSDGSADAAHGAAANPVPDPQSGPPPAGSRDVVARHHHSTRSARWTTMGCGRR